MRWVDQAVTRPHRCAIVPYAGNGRGHRFIDTLQDLDLEHVYVSDVAAEAIAKMLGWVPSYQHAAVQAECESLKLRIFALEDELAEADKFQDNIDGLTKSGFMVKRAPGRPTKKAA